MTKDKQIPFNLIAISTDEFATIKDSYKGEDTVSLTTGFNYGVNENDHTIMVKFSLTFDSNEQPFIILKMSCEFSIEPNSFVKFIDSKRTNIKVPKGLLTHFTILTIGTARGILHERLKNTDYKSFLLPTINVVDLIEEDVVFQIAKSEN